MKHSSPSLRQNDRRRLLICSAVILSLLSLLSACAFGGAHLSFAELLRVIQGRGNAVSRAIFLYVRLPRALGAFSVGAALALSGAVTQATLGNRLASPGIIGVNAGAGLAVTAAAAAGVISGALIALFSFLGALLAVSFVALASALLGASRGSVVLFGVALGTIFGAASDALRTLFPETSLLSADFRIGDLSSVTWGKLIPASILIALSVALLFSLARELDVLSLGDAAAAGLGLRFRRMRPLFLILAALLAASAVMLAGLLSFVGLIVPHMARKLIGESARHFLPLSLLLGGSLVTLADLLSRILLAPHELPVGILMAAIGAPLFILLLLRREGRTL